MDINNGTDEALIIGNQIINTKVIPEIQKSICTFKTHTQKGKVTGTGFFLKIPFKDKYIRALLTCNHVFKIENYMYVVNYCSDGEKKNLELKNRLFWESDRNAFDYTCIQILKEDKLIHFLDIDINILNENYKLEEGKPIRIYNHDLELSPGKIVTKKDKNNNYIYYDCSTEKGWSGGPVLAIDNSVIGIHKGTENKTINFGVFLRYIINDIYEKIEKESDDKKEL